MRLEQPNVRAKKFYMDGNLDSKEGVEVFRDDLGEENFGTK